MIFQDVYTDALLYEHETEIARLEALKEQRAPTLQLIDKHRTLIKERDDLAASSQDASRLMLRGNKGEKRDPTRLLREEKMRKRIAKDLPRIEVELQSILEQWEEEYGRPFLVHGERYLDELAASSSAAKALPPRSKTPSGLPPRSKTPSTLPSGSARPSKAAPPAARLGSSVRGPPPTRAKTPTLMNTIGRNHPINVSSTTTAANRSPSKIPARVPLTTSHNRNSPERARQNDIMQKMPPPRAPPPKMKNLFSPPPSEPDTAQSATIVRYVSPEDVYDDSPATALPASPPPQRPAILVSPCAHSSPTLQPADLRDVQLDSQHRSVRLGELGDVRRRVGAGNGRFNPVLCKAPRGRGKGQACHSGRRLPVA